MKLQDIKKLSEKYLENCIKVYGMSNHFDTAPYLEFDNNIYARLSGEYQMNGEDLPDAEFDSFTNSIIVYYPKVEDEQHLAEIIIHEFQHYLQSPSWMTRYYRMGYRYDNHPYEVAATAEEKNWKLIS